MSSDKRILKYCLALNEAFHQLMDDDDTVFLLGQGVKSPWYVGATANGLLGRFGPDRVIDTPVSENAVTGAAVGAAIAGMRPVVVHPRLDFMMYALDPIINEAANWHYMFGGAECVPVVFWGIINRGGEQAAQHSQALQALFAHIPGLKVVMPSNPYDAKGLMTAAVRDDNPVIFIDDRWLYGVEGEVPECMYEVPIGKGKVCRQGRDVTLVASSHATFLAMDACIRLERVGIDAELIDLRTIKPFDRELVLESVRKTGRLVVVDSGWKSFGVSAEISAFVCEEAFECLRSPVQRVALPDSPAPASRTLEKSYFLDPGDILRSVASAVMVDMNESDCIL